MATRVLLVRHAQSAWNAEGRWQGWADPPLSEPGREAAVRAASDPALEPIEAVVSSDLLRARSTAEILADGLGLGPVTVMRGFRERGAGQWTGLTRAEIDARWPGALAGPGGEAVTPRVPDIPGGESPGAVAARAVAALHRVAAAHPDRTVLVVSHGALIRMVELHAGGEPVPVRNLGGRWVTVEPSGLGLGEAVTLAGAVSARRAD